MNIIVIVCCLVVFLCVGAKSAVAQKEVLSSFCSPSFSDTLKQSNTSFTEGFRFKIDRNGKAVDIKRISGKFVDVEQIESGLKNWKLSGFAENTVFSVFIAWRHGIGWVHMKIISKDFVQVVVSGNKACPDAQGV